MKAPNLQKTYFALFILFFLASCNTDKLVGEIPEGCDDVVTYDGDIKAIIDNSCAYSGCHDGASIPPGNFQSYSGLQPFLSDALFKKFVIDNKDNTEVGMPPSYAPQGKPQDLTTEEIDLVECWILGDYPEQ